MNLRLNLKIKKIIIFIFLLGVLLIVAIYFYINYIKFYNNSDFGIKDLKSSVDFNNNGIDDYTDILLGAKLEVKKRPNISQNIIKMAFRQTE